MTGFDTQVSWAELARRDPSLTAAGERLLSTGGGAAIGFLATGSSHGSPHLAPVCPITCDDWLYLSIGVDSPKRRDLDGNGRYVLHAFLGVDDEEFQMTGRAERVDDPVQRQRVQSVIPFGAFGRDDPIYRLWIERALHGYWIDVGQPGTRPVRRRWRV
jgi:hypothetical protein